ncbi:hypothetical protein INT48_000189 [Thamnidium elegans]|uniref:BHLH domain-containing protein n=1 Tax=Thamnidium elegans TaxID=101142 RepID=A0A8H7W2Z1_9FUNG|nr:hypothetical protein INT48_000189 [Thamnidium elegans]
MSNTSPIITTSAASDRLAQTDADNMNYDTTPTPSFKPQPSNSSVSSRKYYPQENNESWAVTNATTPSESNDEMQQRHMQQLFDKKRRRRESHNAVERRRRDNINERIFELSTLLPERDASKNNKGTILRKSVDHIRLLHEKVNQYQQRVQELETTFTSSL